MNKTSSDYQYLFLMRLFYFLKISLLGIHFSSTLRIMVKSVRKQFGWIIGSTQVKTEFLISISFPIYCHFILEYFVILAKMMKMRINNSLLKFEKTRNHSIDFSFVFIEVDRAHLKILKYLHAHFLTLVSLKR